MNASSALSIAEAYVAKLGRDIGIELVLVGDQTIEFSAGWVFFYDSRDFLEKGEISAALAGNAPLIVGKSDGVVHLTGTARPIEEYIREFESRAGSPRSQ